MNYPTDKLIFALWAICRKHSGKARRLYQYSLDTIDENEKKAVLLGYSEMVCSSIRCLSTALELLSRDVCIDDIKKLDFEFYCYQLLFFIKYEFSTDFNGMEECLVKAVTLEFIFLGFCDPPCTSYFL